MSNQEIGFIAGQLLPHGASQELIAAVECGDRAAIDREIDKISDSVHRDRLQAISLRINQIQATS